MKLSLAGYLVRSDKSANIAYRVLIVFKAVPAYPITTFLFDVPRRLFPTLKPFIFMLDGRIICL